MVTPRPSQSRWADVKSVAPVSPVGRYGLSAGVPLPGAAGVLPLSVPDEWSCFRSSPVTGDGSGILNVSFRSTARTEDSAASSETLPVGTVARTYPSLSVTSPTVPPSWVMRRRTSAVSPRSVASSRVTVAAFLLSAFWSRVRSCEPSLSRSDLRACFGTSGTAAPSGRGTGAAWAGRADRPNRGPVSPAARTAAVSRRLAGVVLRDMVVLLLPGWVCSPGLQSRAGPAHQMEVATIRHVVEPPWNGAGRYR